MSGTVAPITALYEFDATTQTEILACMMWDTDFAKNADGLVNASFFENECEQTMAMIAIDYYGDYKDTPSKTVWLELIKENVKSGAIRSDIKLDVVSKFAETSRLVVRSRAWLLDKIAEFAKQRAIINAMMEASRAIFRESDPERFDKVEKVMRRAFGVSLPSASEDYDFFGRIDERTVERKDIAAGGTTPTGISTGVTELDKLLHHKGWGREELSLLMGGAKSTKSFHLSFFAMRAVQSGYNVLFVTLENSIRILADRFDAQVSGVGQRELITTPYGVENAIKLEAGKSDIGLLKIRGYPGGTFRPGDLRRLVDEYKTKGIKFDLIVIDYMDLMAPDVKSLSPIENSKMVYTDVRAVAQDEKLGVLSATQTNREGHKSAVAKAEHVAEDFNRIRIADVVLAINRTEDERAAQKARITFAACRNQADGYTIFVTQDLEHGLAISKVDSVE